MIEGIENEPPQNFMFNIGQLALKFNNLRTSFLWFPIIKHFNVSPFMNKTSLDQNHLIQMVFIKIFKIGPGQYLGIMIFYHNTLVFFYLNLFFQCPLCVGCFTFFHNSQVLPSQCDNCNITQVPMYFTYLFPDGFRHHII